MRVLRKHFSGATALLLISVPTFPLHASGEPKIVAPANAETNAIAAKFFGLMKTGGAQPALKYLGSLSILYASKQDQIELMATQTDGAIKIYGPVVSWELVESETLGGNVRREFYTVQHANNVVRWRLFFTRSPKGWSVASFNFDDQPQTWF